MRAFGQGLGQLGAGLDHPGAGLVDCLGGDAAAGIEVDDDPEAGAEQLQHAGLDAVVGGEAADQHGRDAAGLQELDKPGAATLGEVVVAGAIGVQIRLDPLPDEEVVVDGGGQAVEQLEARGARHAMGRPGEVGVGQIQRLQHGGRLAHDPGSVRGVGVLAADSQGGEGSLGIERRHYGIPASDGQLVRAEGSESLLRINIQAGDDSHGWLLHIIFL